MIESLQPVDSKKLPRYEGIRTFMRLPHLEELPESGVDYAVMGVPLDGASTFESGQRMGPNAIRNAAVNLRPYHPELDINIIENLTGVDFGDAPMLPGYIEECYANTEKKADEVFAAGAFLIGLGGDHAVTLPLLRAAAKKYGKIGLLHFDSHYDNNPDYFGKAYNHATWVYHGVKEGLLDPAHCIQLGMRGSGFKVNRQDSIDMGITTITTDEMKKLGTEKLGQKMREVLGSGPVFCSFDIDFVDPAFAPGTGTIEPGGFTSYETFEIIREAMDVDIIGMDLVEVLPALDVSNVTANLSAYVIYEFIAALAKRRAKAANK